MSASNIVGSVGEDSPAGAAGLQAGDRVVSINGEPTNDWPAIVRAVKAWGATHHEGDTLEVAWERAGAGTKASVTPRWIVLPDGQRAPMIGLVAGSP